MELSKVLDGFTVADTLVIKAQVQVIHEKPSRPFRCLESQYRWGGLRCVPYTYFTPTSSPPHTPSLPRSPHL